MVNDGFYMYVIECQDGSLYTGYSTNVIRRFKQHVAGKGAKYTRSHPPKKILFYEQFDNQHDALHAEAEFKKKSRTAKFEYIKKHSVDLSYFKDEK